MIPKDVLAKRSLVLASALICSKRLKVVSKPVIRPYPSAMSTITSPIRAYFLFLDRNSSRMLIRVKAVARERIPPRDPERIRAKLMIAIRKISNTLLACS